MYISERATNVGNSLCTSGTTYCNDSVVRTTEWQGKVGLIYPSDFGFASKDASCEFDLKGNDSFCTNENWLYPSSNFYWTISLSSSDFSSRIWFVGNENVVSYTSGYNTSLVRPSIYLKQDIVITGTSLDPYILSE